LQPIDPVRRHFLLMKLIMRFQQGQAGGGMAKQAAELARKLASLIDEVNREGLSFDGLTQLAPENLAGHWQQTLDFLAIISREWPMLLREEGAIDASTHRNQLLAVLGEGWKESPPDYPIIAAGSTGSQPATAALLKIIAGLPQGTVILPALDKDIENEEWKQIADTHPQYGLKKLLEKMEIDKEDVHVINYENSEEIQPNQDKQKYIRSIFAPPTVTANWACIDLPDSQALSGVKLIESDTLLDEARMIAIAMREVLETPEKTAALVTPDRVLARMVCAQLQRFGITIDDSAGRPLDVSPPACFLRLSMNMVATRSSPAALLALLRHPLTAAGVSPAECRRLSRELEILLLRGIRRELGLSGLRKAAIADKKSSPELIALLTNIEENSMKFFELFKPHYNASLQQLLGAHIAFAEWLATSDSQGGSVRLWAGEAGNSLAEIIAGWNMQADVLPPIDSLTYPALFDALLAPETYRSQVGLHPRLHILSPMEARLQSYDLVILSSLNEGVWPSGAQPDPWMSRPQRAAFGLPSPERSIGQSAHDFMMQLFAPEVLLTRARKVEGTPTIPSRWWVRLQTLVGARVPEFFANMNQEKYFMVGKKLLEKPAVILTLTPPAPVPPLVSRPRKLRVTAIDNWLRDPYSLYARYILNLRKLDEIDREPDASDFGNLVHKALENFTRDFPSELPSDEDINEKLLEAGRVAFANFIDRPAVACLWWPRFVAMANWLINEEKIRRNSLEIVHSEINASWSFEVDGKPFTLSTRIDRLEKLKSGSYALIDYKTGSIPTKRDRENGISNQLPLEALIVQNGQLPEGVSAATVSQMEYWKLSGNEVKCEITLVEIDVQETRERLENLIRKFDNPQMPYSAQMDGSLLRYNDYEHLTRRKEWEVV
ncbi:MAG: double-strand break repair protein AddB, partial [Rickettsiales bacterium]